MCHVLSIKPLSYYDWTNCDISKQQIHRNQCELLIRVAHEYTNQCCGVDQLPACLSAQGYDISQYMVRSIKEEYGIKCRRHKRFGIN